MKEYKLFSEYNNKRIIGETLADALTRNGFQDAGTGHRDESGKFTFKEGKAHTIIKILIAERDRNYTRGNSKIVNAVVECDTGKILSVDAVITEVL